MCFGSVAETFSTPKKQGAHENQERDLNLNCTHTTLAYITVEKIEKFCALKKSIQFENKKKYEKDTLLLSGKSELCEHICANLFFQWVENVET
jgi:hypothetical protein